MADLLDKIGTPVAQPKGDLLSQIGTPVTQVKAHTRSLRSFFQPSPEEQRQADIAGETFTKNAATLMTDPGVIGGLATLPFGGEGVPLALARVGVGAGASAIAAKARGEDPGRAALISGGLGTAAELGTLGLNALAGPLTKQWLRLTGKGAEAAPGLAKTVLKARQVLRGAGDLPSEMVAARGASAAATRGMIREASVARPVPVDPAQMPSFEPAARLPEPLPPTRPAAPAVADLAAAARSHMAFADNVAAVAKRRGMDPAEMFALVRGDTRPIDIADAFTKHGLTYGEINDLRGMAPPEATTAIPTTSAPALARAEPNPAPIARAAPPRGVGTTVPIDEMLHQVQARAAELRRAGDPGNELPALAEFESRMRARLPADVPVAQAHLIKRVTQRGGSARFDRFAGATTNPELQKMVAQDTRAAIGSRVKGYNAQDAVTRQAQLGVEQVQKAQGAAEAGAGLRGAGLRRLTAASVGGLAGVGHGQGPAGALALLALEHLSENPYIANRMALTFTDPRFHMLARAFPHLAQSAIPAQ